MTKMVGYRPSLVSAESDADIPLANCVDYAFPAMDRKEYWFYVPALFTPDEPGYAAGDPGWHISRFTNDSGKVMYSAEYNTHLKDVGWLEGEYDEATVKKYFARTMREYARRHPETQARIDQLIQTYQLEPQEELAKPADVKNPPTHERRQGFWSKWFKRQK